MIRPRDFFDELTRRGVVFFAGVPDSLLKEFCAFLADKAPPGRHVIAANEGGALAIAAGFQAGSGGLSLVYLQNSGFGNLINPLLSLADPGVYAIPMVLLVGWRGEPGVKDEPQHQVQGRLQEGLHEALGLPTRIMAADDDPGEAAEWAVTSAQERQGPVALLVRRGTFDKYVPVGPAAGESYPSREDAVRRVIESMGERDILVSTTGMASREVYEVRESRKEGHGRDFLTVGSMGHASQVALGLALVRPDRRVWCLDGDGAALMHLGSLPIIGSLAPDNYVHVLLNNGAHDSVGGQPTVARQVDLAAIAKACGYRWSSQAKDLDALTRILTEKVHTPGSGFVDVWVRKGAREDLGRPTSSPVENKRALQEFLGS